MPQQFWRPLCRCNPDIVAMGRPECPDCGKPGKYLGWNKGMYEAMANYRRRTGLSPIGPHRRLADKVLERRFKACPTCRGRGVLDVNEGEDWEVCPACQGLSYVFKGSKRKFEKIRSRILKEFPRADIWGPKPRLQKARKKSPSADSITLRLAGGENIWPEIHCYLFTLAVRNESLMLKWKGGKRAFWRRYKSMHNDSLTVSSFIAPDIDHPIKELQESGLEPIEDFVCFKASDFILKKKCASIKFPCGWLAGSPLENGIKLHMPR